MNVHVNIYIEISNKPLQAGGLKISRVRNKMALNYLRG